ncbi:MULTISPECIES: HAMP domain-containing sensor histidine kinase [unclassified Paenibacillus]|uniref:sensor histidine kinase n=1 Tax=unclassified Paenibacillus TaxID=185978 RepID=UPI00020D65E1|nr:MULTISPECIES: HAMP domain-containing sensor histidine kinase [unclassified Paenibacillus]EGL20268.1 ATPase/histidine kinase/DNA gyrase B/HSP90 domain protein [Paenibacillus sp. HGF7]EPD88989.1 hypothetical protein HMPREF1207_01732 [Paenibacillus sp. HGH0039]
MTKSRATAFLAFVFTGIVLLTLLFVPATARGQSPLDTIKITEWAYKWDSQGTGPDGTRTPAGTDGWTPANEKGDMPVKPEGVTALWVKIELPRLEWDEPGMLIDKLYGHRIEVFTDERRIYKAGHTYVYDKNRLLIPLSDNESGKTVYIHIETDSDRIGLQKNVKIGDYQALLPGYVKSNLTDVLLGCAFVFIALLMLICTVFLNRGQLAKWLSLSLVILAIGMLMIGSSQFTYTFFEDQGKWIESLFDLALLVFLPTLTLYFEQILGHGTWSMLTKYRWFQIGFSVLCVLFQLVNHLASYRYDKAYYFVTVMLLGLTMLIQFVLLIGMAITHAVKGSKDGITLTTGIGLFAASGVVDLLVFYVKNEQYEFIYWKFGIVCFVTSLIIILGRGFARDHEKIVRYSKELVMYNNELQRAEKMEIISDLAASVAHEVRNPLQVTRGFLQLAAEKLGQKEKGYMNMAIEELDRASNIITDFLTFAKPQLEHITSLNICQELKQIEGILVPLANLQGGVITLEVPEDLYIEGNSSKFKQAFINIIKNSIEALDGQGQIQIWAYKEKNEVWIHIRDNGEGMETKELSKLGEPYFSTKTKGTGLGLMVTFRIIEVMHGRLEFKSEKGVGTEAIVRFPSIPG